MINWGQIPIISGLLRKPAAGERPAAHERWIALDVETSGLDARRDRLLAIAAIGLRVDWAAQRLVIVPGDSFEVVLRQEVASTKDNILLHGIGAQRQRDGVEPAAALQAFAEYAGTAPL
ncbi:MAG: exonuclease domain-containing protein, partial [Burkholderiaceae bacterium]